MVGASGCAGLLSLDHSKGTSKDIHQRNNVLEMGVLFSSPDMLTEFDSAQLHMLALRTVVQADAQPLWWARHRN